MLMPTTGEVRDRSFHVLTLVLALLILMPTTAQADPKKVERWVFDEGSGYRCLKGLSETSHGTGDGYSRTLAWAWKENVVIINNTQYRFPCNKAWTVAAYDLAVKFYIYYYVNGSPVYCDGIGYRYNTSSDYKLEWARNWESTHPGLCGTRTYNTHSSDLVRWNGAWRGDWTWSGTHVLPV